MHIVGIDPATAGSVVLCSVHGGALRAELAVFWRKVGARFFVYSAPNPKLTSVKPRIERHYTLSHVAYVARDCVEEVLAAQNASAPLLAMERAFMGKNAASSVLVATNCGRFAAPFEVSYSQRPVDVYIAIEWRKSVLGCKANTPRERAKALSVELVPQQVQGLSEILAALKVEGAGSDLDDVCDAAGVALYHAKVKGLLT